MKTPAIKDDRTPEQKAADKTAMLSDMEAWRRKRDEEEAARQTPDIEGALETLKATLATAKPISGHEEREHLLRTSIYPRLAACGWEKRFFTEHLGDWGCAEQLAKFARCQQLFAGHGAIVALVGPRGVGKTTIGFQLALHRLRADWLRMLGERSDECRGVTLRMTPYRKLTDLIARFKALYADFGTTDPEKLAASRDALCRDDSLLVMDEVHECSELRAAPRMLTDILDRRYAAKRDTLLITNQTAQEFSDTIGDSIYSRLTEHGAILRCEWKSWRERK